MPTLNMIQALNDAHKVMMRRDDDIVVFGEDMGSFGGVFRVTEGLQKEFGKTRVFDVPIAEGEDDLFAGLGSPEEADRLATSGDLTVAHDGRKESIL